MAACAHAYVHRPCADNGVWIQAYIQVCRLCGDVGGYLVPDATLTLWTLVPPVCPTCGLVDCLPCSNGWHNLFHPFRVCKTSPGGEALETGKDGAPS